MKQHTTAIIGEVLGTAILLFIVVASGIAAESMSDVFALQLGLHALAVAAALGALIVFIGPLSGAHFNPAVTLGFLIDRTTDTRTAVAYVVAQIAGGVLGVMVANAMFGYAWIELSTQVRSGADQLLSEFVGTFVLVFLVIGLVRVGKIGPIAPVVAAWVFAIIIATPSYGFVNPAVTIARALTDTFTGIAPESVMPFVAVQLFAAAVASFAAVALYTRTTSDVPTDEREPA